MSTEAPRKPVLRLDSEAVESTRQPVERATMLPPAAFADPSVFAWELDEIFSGWVCAGHVSQVSSPGAYVVREVGPDSVIVICGSDGRPRAFLNACRHRGARLLEDAEGTVRKRIRCPYHSWSYDLEGELRAAPHMDEVENFEFNCWGLIPVRSTVVGGLVMFDLSGEAPPIEDHIGGLEPLLARYRNAELVRAGERHYEVAANWKGIAENYSECLHCPGIHPELNELSNYMTGESYEGSGAWCGGSMTIKEGAATMGREGAEAPGRPPIKGLEGEEHHLVLYFVLFPNALVSMHPDYVMLHTLWPRGEDRTEIVCEWYFEPETVAREDFDPSDAVGFWDQVNKEDWYVCELTQKGVATRGYVAGRYSAQEYDVHRFDRMVADRYAEALRTEVAA
ncbi:aromatic ring-hydroxylating dioxygenase subunit alpha [Thermoleophilia bacterium SCSIO 60948]|nr:aromatic ring-hydroxylating dioxygenase subunit alpha [Thermoleophilia bacterium SCSIO 60948]